MPRDKSSARSRALVVTWLWSALSGATAAASTAPVGKRPMRPVLVMPRRETFEPVDLIAPNNNTRIQFRPYDSQGRLRPGARRELSHLLRCPHTGEEHLVDPRLVPVLYRLGRHFGRPVVISSGYRPPELATRPRSRHMRAAAIDFFIPGVDNADLVRWLRQTFHPLGVGYYPDGVHVHLDVDRERDAYWVQAGSDALPLGGRQARAPHPERRKQTPSGRPPRK